MWWKGVQMEKDGLLGINMTNFFNRELFMYSLGDIKFKKPISLKRMAYTLGFLLVWSLPIIIVFGLRFNLLFLLFSIAPPLLAGYYATKPAFGGKTLIDFTRTIIAFVKEPKGWLDLRPTKYLGDDVYFVENEIWISRRRELQLLADIKDEIKSKPRNRPVQT